MIVTLCECKWRVLTSRKQQEGQEKDRPARRPRHPCTENFPGPTGRALWCVCFTTTARCGETPGILTSSARCAALFWGVPQSRQLPLPFTARIGCCISQRTPACAHSDGRTRHRRTEGVTRHLTSDSWNRSGAGGQLKAMESVQTALVGRPVRPALGQEHGDQFRHHWEETGENILDGETGDEKAYNHW
ncbi:hypothetical protein Bbelb_440850 [Branchiostoma belcheri]|nr:hypothetical protein Bbelb_440850 [Branchiostoma belcheri]